MKDLLGKKQLTRTVVSESSLETIWGIMTDTNALPHWAPAVERLEQFDGTGETKGSVRVCAVKLGGRTGTVVERIIDIEPKSHITYAIDKDSFGMNRMFADYSFRLTVKQDGKKTLIMNETFYTPRNFFYSFINVFMKLQFANVVDGILNGLSDYAAQSR